MRRWKQTGNRRVFLLGIILLFLFLVTLRSVHLTADPPSRLSWSGGLYGDEPAYAHNARNKAVFGTWVLDEWNPVLYNPILTLFDYLSFKTFGTGFTGLRMVALFWGVLSLVFIYWVFRLSFGAGWVAVLGVFLLETNYFFLMYTRLSLSDTMLTNWMILTLFLWAAGRERAVLRFLSGLSAVAVFSCKPTAIYFAGVVGLAYLYAYIQESQTLKDWKGTMFYLLPFVSGLGVGLGIWFVVYYLPFHGQIARYSTEWSKLSMPRGIADFADRVIGRHAPIVFKHFAWFPFILLAGWFYLPVSLYRIVKGWRETNPLEFFALAWFTVGYFALSGFRYRPARYFVSLVPPLVILTVCCLYALKAENGENKKTRYAWSRGILYLLYGAWCLLTVFLSKKYLHFSERDFLIGGIVFLCASVGFWFVAKKGRTLRIGHVLRDGFIITVVSLAVPHNLALYAKWWTRPAYKEVEISRAVGKIVKGETIAGLWSPMVCMENDNRALCIAPGWFNDRDPYGRYKFAYLFLWRGNRDAELSMVRRVLGKQFLKKRLRPVARFKIKDAWAYLFRVIEK